MGAASESGRAAAGATAWVAVVRKHYNVRYVGVKRNVNKAFSCTVALRDWERLNERYCIGESLGHPYAFCGRTCVAQLLKWAKNKGIRQQDVKFFFEDGATHRGQLEKILQANDGIGPLFVSKSLMVQFGSIAKLVRRTQERLSVLPETLY